MRIEAQLLMRPKKVNNERRNLCFVVINYMYYVRTLRIINPACCTYGFRMMLTVNIKPNYFLILNHSPIVLVSCFLWGVEWILKYYIRLQLRTPYIGNFWSFCVPSWILFVIHPLELSGKYQHLVAKLENVGKKLQWILPTKYIFQYVYGSLTSRKVLRLTALLPLRRKS
jgi:hypothetical protein